MFINFILMIYNVQVNFNTSVEMFFSPIIQISVYILMSMNIDYVMKPVKVDYIYYFHMYLLFEYIKAEIRSLK